MGLYSGSAKSQFAVTSVLFTNVAWWAFGVNGIDRSLGNLYVHFNSITPMPTVKLHIFPKSAMSALYIIRRKSGFTVYASAELCPFIVKSSRSLLISFSKYGTNQRIRSVKPEYVAHGDVKMQRATCKK